MIFIIICVVIAVFGLQPLLLIWFDPTVDADLKKMTYCYVGYGVFCLLVYYFIVMPIFQLPGLDLSNINIGGTPSGAVLMSGVGLGFVSFLLSLNSDSTAAKTIDEAVPAQKDDELIAKLTAVINSHKDEGYSANLLN